jgi:short subunit dehydrogenase-like uncharacterized protein
MDAQGRPFKVEGKVKGASDPGYGETAKMLGEAAKLLATQPPVPNARGGVLTPACALGTALVDRLRSAGMTWDVQAV